MNTTEEMTHYIRPEQLCVGLYIHLDLSWMDHPFTFSSFKIQNENQIATLRRLGLEKIRYSPVKSDQALAPAPTAPTERVETATTPTTESIPADETAREAKRARMQQLKAQRAAIEKCEKDFLLSLIHI